MGCGRSCSRYELFLNKNPEWRGKIVLIQVALSTSEKSELDATVSDIVTRVNSFWANLAYQPVSVSQAGH